MLLLLLFLAAQGASLRGIHAVNATTIWASGSKGTVLLSTDAGKTWTPHNPPDAESLDFRSVYAFSATKAFILSSGDKEKSKLFRTDDAGRHWTLLYTSHEGFLDGLKFWDANHGIILGDPIDGSPVLLTTVDAGQTWQRRTVPAGDEGAFAASNSSLAIRGKQEAWFGTTASRVYRTKDGGKTWTVTQTPIRHDTKSAGIFSLFFQPDRKHGIAVGGEYTKAKEDAHNIAITSDGGRTWTEPTQRPHGYRSAVACIQQTCIATGPEATDRSTDGGQTWTTLDKPGYHAVTLAGPVIYAAGSDGRLGSLHPLAK
jgi:photosystem II stability/assembly factor-like uncharacterized protein